MTCSWGTQSYDALCCDVLNVEHVVNVSELKSVHNSFVQQIRAVSKYWMNCTKRNSVRVCNRPDKNIQQTNISIKKKIKEEKG